MRLKRCSLSGQAFLDGTEPCGPAWLLWVSVMPAVARDFLCTRGHAGRKRQAHLGRIPGKAHTRLWCVLPKHPSQCRDPTWEQPHRTQRTKGTTPLLPPTPPRVGVPQPQENPRNQSRSMGIGSGCSETQMPLHGVRGNPCRSFLRPHPTVREVQESCTEHV